MTDLGRQLHQAREISGLELAQLASKAGVADGEILRLEACDGEVRLQSLLMLTRALCGRLEFVPDPVQRMIYEIAGDDALGQEFGRGQGSLEGLNGVIMIRGTGFSVGQVLDAFGEGLVSARELAAGTGIPRRVILEALRELAGKLGNLPPQKPQG
jgi:transcriptional regulator with XRE-family HTH domain